MKHPTSIFKQIFSLRFFIYILGIMILAMGITLNTKTALGVSPIISVPYGISVISGIRLGTMTFLFYSLLVVFQWLLLGKDFRPYQLLQVVMSLITSVFIDLFDRMVPAQEDLLLRILTLALAILLTGLGASLTVGMRIVPNPADGLANVLGMKLKKGFGFGKNVFDFSCIILSLIIGGLFAGQILGIGAGTLAAMIFTGRVVAVCQAKLHPFYEKVTGGGS